VNFAGTGAFRFALVDCHIGKQPSRLLRPTGVPPVGEPSSPRSMPSNPVTTGGAARYRSVSRRTGVPPVLADGLPACRFLGGLAACFAIATKARGRAVCPHRLEACSPIKKRKTNGIGRNRLSSVTAGTAVLRYLS
jgi:hypothetical protein